ncbi:MAG TPA: beta-galactosidase, partial [Vicinamibacterales bacterium]|nr:beta-galactosidase [Vicinamibacterales bacterium]
MTRREWLRLTAAGGGALLLPNVTGVLDGAARAVRPSQRPAGSPARTRERLLADFGWKFHLGHASDPSRDFGFGREGGDGTWGKSGYFLPGVGRGKPGVAQWGFDTSGWQSVDLPHDWAVDLPFVDDRAVNGHGAKPLGRAYPDTSVGWYRREFTIEPASAGRRFALEFDGVFRDAIVVLNNHFIGRNLSGYAPARYDVTDFLTYATRDASGAESPGRNVLLVRADATEAEGWFYEGAGIYRHVWLESTSPVHVAPHGTFVTTEVRGAEAIVTVRTEIDNDSDNPTTASVLSSIENGEGAHAGASTSTPTSVPAWSRATVVQKIAVPHPRLWSVEQPSMYRLRTTVKTGAGEVDHYETPFGIRTIHFDASRGLFVNGKPVKVKGTCNHQDHAG